MIACESSEVAPVAPATKFDVLVAVAVIAEYIAVAGKLTLKSTSDGDTLSVIVTVVLPKYVCIYVVSYRVNGIFSNDATTKL